ncbi:MAG: hypothetical protein ABIG69_20695, partial [Bacteroidota bacterium]
MLGNGSNTLTLEYGKIYYLDLKINDINDLDFGGYERQIFQSPVGVIDSGDLNASDDYTFNSLNINSNVNMTSIGNLNLARNIIIAGNITNPVKISAGSLNLQTAFNLSETINMTSAGAITMASDLKINRTINLTAGGSI